MTEFRPGSFQILPTVIKNLLIINTLIFLAQTTFKAPGDFNFNDNLALHTWQSELFKPWQFFTYMFLHGSWSHLLGNMFVLWMFGSTLENLWGPNRFLVFYLVSGLGAALCHMGVLYFENHQMIAQLNAIDSAPALQNFIAKYGDGYRVPLNIEAASELTQLRLDVPTLGASGAVFGCLAAFGYLFPDDYIYIYFAIPIKVKWFVIVYIGGELMLQIQNSAGDSIAHVAHLGGALVGFLMVYFWNKNNRRKIY